MLKQLRAAVVAFVLLSVLTGLAYPALITGIAQVVFPKQANGSLIMQNGQAIGSELIGQSFSDPKYFWGRLSAISVAVTMPDGSSSSYSAPYSPFYSDPNGNTTGSAGSNLGPLNPALIASGKDKDANGTPIPEGNVQSAIDALHAADPENTALIPVDLVTASASGLDPDISPAGAKYQVHRVAKARGLADSVVQTVVDQHTTGRSLLVLGEPHVNVLELNIALDAVPGQNPPPAATAAATIAATAAATLNATVVATSSAATVNVTTAATMNAAIVATPSATTATTTQSTAAF